MAEQYQNPSQESARRALNTRQAAEYLGMSHKFMESPKGKQIFPPVRIAKRNVYFTDILDQQINKLAIASGALPAGGGQ